MPHESPNRWLSFWAKSTGPCSHLCTKKIRSISGWQRGGWIHRWVTEHSLTLMAKSRWQVYGYSLKKYFRFTICLKFFIIKCRGWRRISPRIKKIHICKTNHLGGGSFIEKDLPDCFFKQGHPFWGRQYTNEVDIILAEIVLEILHS